MTANNLADVLVATGELAEAREIYAEGREWARRSGNAMAHQWCALGLARCAHYAGDGDAAATLLADAVVDKSLGITLTEIVRAHLVLEADPRRAGESAATALAYATQTGHNEMRLDALALMARAAHALGDREAAGQALDEFLIRLSERGSTATGASSLAEAAPALAALDRHAELARAAEGMIPSGWCDAALAVSEQRYPEAAAILDRLPCIPLRDAVTALAALPGGTAERRW